MVYNKFNEYLKIDILLSINTLSVTLRTLQGVIGKLGPFLHGSCLFIHIKLELFIVQY